MMCKYCDNGESLVENDHVNVDIQDNKMYVYSRDHDSMGIMYIGYCPMCGKKLDGYRE